MKGGLLTLVGWKIISGLVACALIGAALVAFIGPKDAASAYGTGATVIGQGTGITVASLPKFVKGIHDGQQAVNGSGDVKAKSEKK